MTTATLTLSEFLLARIAEDEDAAQEAGLEPRVQIDPGTPLRPSHWDRWDPARVLAECRAKAGVVGAYRGAVNSRDALIDSGADAPLITLAGTAVAALELALTALALPYAQHADYQQEWRP